MRRLFLAGLLSLVFASTAVAKPPPCRGDQHRARVNAALAGALANPADDLAVAYGAFVDGLGSLDGVSATGRLPAGFAGRARDFYLRPRENGWVRVVYSGSNYRIHDKSPTDPETCVDEFLLIIATPLYGKWGSEFRYFVVTAQVDNRRAGPAPVVLHHLEP